MLLATLAICLVFGLIVIFWFFIFDKKIEKPFEILVDYVIYLRKKSLEKDKNRIIKIEAISLKKKDSNNILVSIYNKTSLKLIYNFNYVEFYMNGEVVKLKRVNDFYVLE